MFYPCLSLSLQDEAINHLFDDIDDSMREIIQIYDGMETLEALPLEEGNDEAASYSSRVVDQFQKERRGVNRIQCNFKLKSRSALLFQALHARLSVFPHLLELDRRKERLDRIREKRWAKGNVLTEQEQSLMSKEEINYFQQYDSLLNSYMQHTGFDLSAVLISFAYSVFVEIY